MAVVSSRAARRTPLARVVSAALLLLAAAALGAEDDVAARVNGTPISEETVNDVVRGVIKSRRTPPSSEEIAALNDAALDELIELELLYQEAQARGLTVDEAAVTAEIQRTRARFTNPKQYDAALAQSGLSDAELRADTRKTLMVNRLLTEVVFKEIRIGPEDARRFYAENNAAFVRDGRALTLEQAEPSIRRVLREDEERRRREAFVATLRGRARVERPTPGE